MIEILSKREALTYITYFHEFDHKTNPGQGFSFQVDADHNFIHPEHVELFKEKTADKTLDYLGIKTYKNRYIEPARGRCRCGEEVTLRDDFYGATSCPRCGQFYSVSGNELLPPDQWEERLEDDY